MRMPRKGRSGWHIGASGSLATCDAETPETCRATSLSNGDPSPHFTDFAEGQARVEELNEAKYGLMPKPIGEKVRSDSELFLAKEVVGVHQRRVGQLDSAIRWMERDMYSPEEGVRNHAIGLAVGTARQTSLGYKYNERDPKKLMADLVDERSKQHRMMSDSIRKMRRIEDRLTRGGNSSE